MSIEAMKQALEFLRSGNFVYPTKIATDLDQAIAEAEKQEPIYAHPDPDALHAAYIMGVQDGKKMREWVGLTDQEYLSLADQIDDATGIDLIEYGQAVIAKWKEKNGWSS